MKTSGCQGHGGGHALAANSFRILVWLVCAPALFACKGKIDTPPIPPTAPTEPPSVPPADPGTPPLLELIVAPDGAQSNPGTAAAPTTLEGARAIVRAAQRTRPGPLRVLLRGGTYFRSSSFTLSSLDSGTPENPVEYVAYPGETPRLVGGAAIGPQTLTPVTSSDPNWNRLDPDTRSQIRVADLSAFSNDLGSLASRTPVNTTPGNSWVNKSMEIFTDGSPLTLARYPDAVDSESVDLAHRSDVRVSGSTTPDVTGVYAYKGLDSLGRPYYQLAKSGQVWTISASSIGSIWQLNNRADLPGTSGNSSYMLWGSFEVLRGPSGRYSAIHGGAKGDAFLEPVNPSLPPLPGYLLIRSTDGATSILSPDTRMSRWTQIQEAMTYQYGYYVWDAYHAQIGSLDAATGSIRLTAKPRYGLRMGQPFFVYNLLEELTAPGEYYLDRTSARLYLRPLGTSSPSEVLVSLLQSPLVTMTGAKHVRWRGLVFEVARETLVEATDGEAISFQECIFRNSGGWGLRLSGYRNWVDRCEFKQLGKGGIQVWGGDRATIRRSDTVIQNCDIHHYGRVFPTYFPAVNVVSSGHGHFQDDCMGITVQNNEIHHGPYIGLVFQGSEQLIRNNHVHHVCQWINDSGAIYSMRDWGSRRNFVQSNLIRDNGGPLGNQIFGVYLDMCASGATVEQNIFYRAGPEFAVAHAGGRDVKVRYNVFSGHWYGAFVNNPGMTVANDRPGDTGNLLEKLRHFDYQSPPWSTAYPELAVIPNDWSQLQGSHWLQPEGSVYYGNLQHGFTKDVVRDASYLPAAPEPLSCCVQVAENLEQVDPRFVDPAKLDFRLEPTSPMHSVPGFPGIDATKIGIQR